MFIWFSSDWSGKREIYVCCLKSIHAIKETFFKLWKLYMIILYTYDRGIARIFQRGGGHSVSHPGYSVHCHVENTLIRNKFQHNNTHRRLSHSGHFESQENKKLCFCPSSLALDERLDMQNLLFQHCVIKVCLRNSVPKHSQNDLNMSFNLEMKVIFFRLFEGLNKGTSITLNT